MKITNKKELDKLQEEYKQNHKEYNKQVYASRFSEYSRIVKLIRVFKIKKSLEETFKALLTMLAKDMHPHLKYEDLENDAYYRSGTKNKKKHMHLACFKENNEVTIEWFTADAWVSKNFKLKANKDNSVTKIKLLEILKGKKAKTGQFEQMMRNHYIKVEILRFDMQMFELRRDLNLLSDKELINYELKNLRYQNRISKIRLFSR